MRKQVMTPAPLLVVACLLLSGGPPAAGQERSQAAYRVKPSEVAVPEGVPFGQYRRSITPFEHWTLICDENLYARQMVCNVTQIIVDQTGRTVFSWSLAAAENGQPFMLLRTAPTAQAGGVISVRFPDRPDPLEVSIEGCDETVCVGMAPIDPILREQIGQGAEPRISYATASGDIISVTAPLSGLETALSAIN